MHHRTFERNAPRDVEVLRVNNDEVRFFSYPLVRRALLWFVESRLLLLNGGAKPLVVPVFCESGLMYLRSYEGFLLKAALLSEFVQLNSGTLWL